MKEAPLYAEAHDLARWIVENVPHDAPLPRRLHESSIDLLESVVLALKKHEREARIDEADSICVRLRACLRLACDTRTIDERRLLHLAERLDSIGRQIGGWKRRLAGDTVAPRRR